MFLLESAPSELFLFLTSYFLLPTALAPRLPALYLGVVPERSFSLGFGLDVADRFSLVDQAHRLADTWPRREV